MYWDNGPTGVERFLKHHRRVCSENSICNRIGMLHLQYEVPDGDDGASVLDERPTTPPRRTRARSVSESPNQVRKKRGPHRAGTSDVLFTVEDFLRLNDLSRVSVTSSVTSSVTEREPEADKGI